MDPFSSKLSVSLRTRERFYDSCGVFPTLSLTYIRSYQDHKIDLVKPVGESVKNNEVTTVLFRK